MINVNLKYAIFTKNVDFFSFLKPHGVYEHVLSDEAEGRVRYYISEPE